LHLARETRSRGVRRSLQEMATCAEGVVRHLTERFPDAPVVRTAA
jgi:hypothetical protein